jgi:hypothetical protein
MPAPGGYLFGYGSLVNRRSLGRALGREVAAEELRAARLDGWRRTWGAAEQVIPDGRTAVLWAQFLDLERDPTARVNGILIEITDAEREALERRERGYNRLDVTIDGTPAITFAGRREAAPEGDVVLAAYVELVEEGFAALGDEHLEEFRRTTDPIDTPILVGPYRFADAGQNALTTWGAKGA